MTKQDLNRHLELVQQLEHCRELLTTLEAAAGPRAQRLDGMPHAPGIRDGVGDLAAEIADTKAEIECLQAEIVRSEAEVAAWIGTIEDMQTRIIFRLRYIRGGTWKEVAALIGGGNTEQGVKNRAYRYIQAHTGSGKGGAKVG